MTATLDRLARVLADTAGVDPAEVVEAATFRDDLDLDSLTMTEVMMALEEEFDVTLTGTEAASRVVSAGTVGDALGLLRTQPSDLQPSDLQPSDPGPAKAAVAGGPR